MKKFAKKFLSMKLLITLWAMAIITMLVRRGEADSKACAALCTLPVAYCCANVAQKYMRRNNEPRHDSPLPGSANETEKRGR